MASSTSRQRQFSRFMRPFAMRRNWANTLTPRTNMNNRTCPQSDQNSELAQLLFDDSQEKRRNLMKRSSQNKRDKKVARSYIVERTEDYDVKKILEDLSEEEETETSCQKSARFIRRSFKAARSTIRRLVNRGQRESPEEDEPSPDPDQEPSEDEKPVIMAIVKVEEKLFRKMHSFIGGFEDGIHFGPYYEINDKDRKAIAAEENLNVYNSMEEFLATVEPTDIVMVRMVPERREKEESDQSSLDSSDIESDEEFEEESDQSSLDSSDIESDEEFEEESDQSSLDSSDIESDE